MSAEELRHIATRMGMNVTQLAKALDVGEPLMHEMMMGTYPIPDRVKAQVETMAGKQGSAATGMVIVNTPDPEMTEKILEEIHVTINQYTLGTTPDRANLVRHFGETGAGIIHVTANVVAHALRGAVMFLGAYAAYKLLGLG